MHTQNIALIPDCISEHLNGGKRSVGGNANSAVITSANTFSSVAMTGGLLQANLANTSIIAFEPLATGAIRVTTNQNNNAYKY